MINKILSLISYAFELIIRKLWSLIYLIFLKLRGLNGGLGLRVHSSVTFRGWLCCAEMGRNVVLHRGCNINIARGSMLILKNRVWISYNTVIIASKGTITSIGENTMFGGNCTIVSADHDINDVPSLRDSGHIGGDITIGDNCWIGANCVITKGVTIGEGAIIGAGSVVTKDIPPFTIAVGSPAKVIKQRNIAKK